MKHIRQLLHAGISVYNMEESVDWYERNLGFRIRADRGFVPALRARIVFLERDGLELELFEYESPKPMPEECRMPNSDLQRVGTKHIAFAVDDMDAVRSEFLEHGVDIAHEVRMAGNSVMFVRDCNGILIEFIEENSSRAPQDPAHDSGQR